MIATPDVDALSTHLVDIATCAALDADATLLTDSPKSGGRVAPGDFERFGALVGRFRAVRRLGSTALHLAYVACGRAEATFSIDTNAWDLAAGMFLVQQAGGRYLPAPVGAAPADRPWLAPSFVATCPEFDLARSTLGAVIWDDLLAAPAGRGHPNRSTARRKSFQSRSSGAQRRISQIDM